MFRRLRNTRVVVVGLVALAAAAIVASGVIASQGELENPDALEAALRSDPLFKVAELGAAGGLAARGVFAQKTSTGLLCLWDAPSAEAPSRQGGCNSADDPLGGRKLLMSFAYEGGPTAATVTDARLIGLTSMDVSIVEVAMTDGTRRKIPLRKASVGSDEYRAFGYRVSQADLRKGVTPTAVVALDEAGREIDRQATGVAG